MHNTDRTQQYMEVGGYSPTIYGRPGPASAEFEWGAGAGMQGEAASQMEYVGELVNPATGEVNAEAEMAMAAELLSVSNEQELNHFLGNLIRNVGRGFSRFASSGLGRTLGGALRNVAKAALPLAGGALGTLIPIPGVGTALGAAAGQMASSALGLEFEGMSHEDREFEVARRIVRIGVESARALDQMPEGEFASEQEILSAIGNIARSALPAIGNALLGGLTGQASGGGQAGGGLAGGVQITSPGGWNFSAGGQAGGQIQGGGAVGVGAPAPQPPSYQPRPHNGAGHPRPAPQQGPGQGHAAGRWIKRGRHLIVLNAFAA